MPIRKLALTLIFLALPGVATGEFCEQNKGNIFTIDSVLPSGHSVRLTGFRAKGFPGILTSLHGVAGADTITATPNDSSRPILANLQVAWLDIPNDIAALELEDSSLPAGGLETSGEDVSPHEMLIGCGHPYGNDLRNRSAPANALPLKPLSSFTATDAALFYKRQSPAPSIIVIDLEASMTPGESGEPVVDSVGRVRGIADGGIDRGGANISWAIPIGQLHLKRSEDSAEGLATLLSHGSSTLVFAYEPGNAVNPNEFVVSMDGGKSHTLAYALAKARTGDIILLRPGTYQIEPHNATSCGQLTTSETLRSVTLKGTSNREDTVVRGSLCIPEGISVTFSDFTLFGAIVNHGQADLTGLRVSADLGSSLILDQGSLNRIDRSTVEARKMAAIDVKMTATVNIANSHVSSDREAIDVSDSSRLIIDRCVFEAGKEAISGSGSHIEIRNSDLRKVRGRPDLFDADSYHLVSNSGGYVFMDAYTKSHR